MRLLLLHYANVPGWDGSESRSHGVSSTAAKLSFRRHHDDSGSKLSRHSVVRLQMGNVWREAVAEMQSSST